jgi:ATP-binding cassette subfamily C protein CydD
VGLFVLLLAPEVYLPIRQVGAHFHAASEGVASSKRVLDIIDLAHAEKTDKELERRSDINFEPGKLTVIVGPSGAGKTTIFRQMLGLGDSKSEIKHEHVAWMPQEPSLFSSTIRDNIVGFESVNDSALQQAIKLAAIDDLRLDDYVGLGGSRISGGQAQRVALARTFYRAICKNTQTILLDEPISALDEHRSRIVIESIKYFARKGKTVVAITHQDQLIKAADCVYEVKNA